MDSYSLVSLAALEQRRQNARTLAVIGDILRCQEIAGFAYEIIRQPRCLWPERQR